MSRTLPASRPPEGIVGLVRGPEDRGPKRPDLAHRYAAQWTEADAAARRTAIERLWAEDGTHVLQPPLEIREIVAKQGITFRARPDAVAEARGLHVPRLVSDGHGTV